MVKPNSKRKVGIKVVNDSSDNTDNTDKIEINNSENFSQKIVTPGGVEFTHKDIESVVNDFYYRIQQDPLLSVPFQSVHDWPDHVKRLTHFWWIRFGGESYMFGQYNPVVKHFFSGFNDVLLARWLKMFHETLNDHLNDKQIELWKVITEKMGVSLSIRNVSYGKEYEKSKQS